MVSVPEEQCWDAHRPAG